MAQRINQGKVMTNLFILPTRLGDAILATGGIDKYKTEPLVIVATSLTAPLFADLPHLEGLILMEKKPWRKHWFDLWQKTHTKPWNRIVDFRGSALSYLLKAEERYMWRQPRQTPHKVLQISQCLRSKEPLAPTLWFSKNRLAKAKFKRPTLAVAPVAGWIGKQWPLDRLHLLLAEFCEKNPQAQVAFFAAPNERSQVETLLKALPSEQCIDTIGMDLLDVAASLKSARLFMGNDSGLMHISAAVKTPTIAFFGPSNDQIYGPWSSLTPSPHRVLRAMPLPKKKIIQTPEDTTCYMMGLSLEEVREVLFERWEACQKEIKPEQE